jgi:hypothetical protein
MKTWHWVALGVAGYVIWAYRSRFANALSAGQGPAAVMLPTPNPAAGLAGLGASGCGTWSTVNGVPVFLPCK